MSKLICGFSQKIITPVEKGIFLDGYGYRLTPAEGKMDDLYVKVAYFQKGSEQYVIAAFDICGLNTDVYNIVTKEIKSLTDIAPDNISLCATHTHSGPASGVLDIVSINYEYWEYIGEICGAAILEAKNNACECKCASAVSDVEFSHTINRRQRPFIDRRIKAMVFTDLNDNIKGVISSANCHPVINMSMDYSADYPSVLTRESLAKYNVPFLFLQGRGADINPNIDPSLGIKNNIEMVGGQLTEGVFNAVDKAVSSLSEINAFKFSSEKVSIPVKGFDNLEQIDDMVKYYTDEYHNQSWGEQKHYSLVELMWYRSQSDMTKNGEKPQIEIPLKVLNIDDKFAFAFFPFELLTATGNKMEEYLISKGYAPANIYTVGYANTVNSYLPPVEEFPIGGYEIGGVRGAASHWYNLPEYLEQTEGVVLDKMAELFEAIN